MKKVIFTLLLFAFFIPTVFAQRILINQNFENTGFGPDSLPPNWAKFSEDPISGPGREWAVRDTGKFYVGSTVLKTRAHNSVRALTCPWTAGDPIADDWVFTDSFTVKTGDSLIFWMLIGPDSLYSSGFLDTMQVWVMSEQIPTFTLQKLATLKSNDSAGVPLANNTWKIYKFPLSAFNGQKVYVAFRYYMNTSVDGFWCNIDDVFIGNRSYIGINQIGTNMPKTFSLYQNYPNPFNPTTKIKFDIPRNTHVKLEIYNSIGQQMKVLHDAYTNAGYYETDFNAGSLSSGMYFYRLTTPDYVETKKMILVK